MVSHSIAIFLGLILLGLCFFTVHSGSDRFVPGLFHNAAWCIALLIVGSDLMNYDPLSIYAWTVILIGLLGFNLGLAMAPKARGVDPRPIGDSQEHSALMTKRQYLGLLVLFSIGLAIYLWSISTSFGLRTLIQNPTSIREYSSVNYLENFPLIGKLLFYLGPLCFVASIFPRFVEGLAGHRGRWAIASYVAIAQLATLQRTNLFVCLLWACGIVLLTKVSSGDRLISNPRRVFSLIAVGVIALIAFQGLAVALGKTGTNNPAIYSVVDPRIKQSPYTGMMYYASSGVPAFGKLVESRNRDWPPEQVGGPIYGDYNPQVHGRATFSSFAKALPGMRKWRDIAPFTQLPIPTNVFTWLEPWYRDFRGFGVALGSVVAGLAFGHFAQKGTRSPEAFLLASLLIGLSGLAAFVNSLLTVLSIVLYASLWLLGRSRRNRGRKVSRTKPLGRQRTSATLAGRGRSTGSAAN